MIVVISCNLVDKASASVKIMHTDQKSRKNVLTHASVTRIICAAVERGETFFLI